MTAIQFQAVDHAERVRLSRLARWGDLSVEERFWAKVDASGDCWEWTGSRKPAGYGQFMVDRPVYAHRFAYALLVGPIPEGMQLDHLCRVRHCVNPDHLALVTSRENTYRGQSPAARAARRGACERGHVYTDETTYRYGRTRICRVCRAIREKRSAA